MGSARKIGFGAASSEAAASNRDDLICSSVSIFFSEAGYKFLHLAGSVRPWECEPRVGEKVSPQPAIGLPPGCESLQGSAALRMHRRLLSFGASR